jgi:hypothetical protein
MATTLPESETLAARAAACDPSLTGIAELIHTRPVPRRQQRQGLDVDGGGEALDDLQREVALAALDSADVRSMIAEDISR